MTSAIKNSRTVLLTILLVNLAAPVFAGKQGRVDMVAMQTANYIVDGDAFIGHNRDGYSNRPLYCNHIYAIVLAGDKPYSQVGLLAHVFGNFMFALVRDGKGTWLQNASDITSIYRPGRMEWTVKDAAWGTTAVNFEVVPSAEGPRHGCARQGRWSTARRSARMGQRLGLYQRKCQRTDEHSLGL